MTTDPNTDDYAQFVGRMAYEMREALAPHLGLAVTLPRTIVSRLFSRKEAPAPPLPIDVAEAISFAWGARSLHAKLLAPPHEMPEAPKSLLAKVERGETLTLDELQAILYGQTWAGGARFFRGLRPRFVHCEGCALPVPPSRWRFTFAPAELSEEQMTKACDMVRANRHAEAMSRVDALKAEQRTEDKAWLRSEAASLHLMHDGVTQASVSEAKK